MMCPYLLISINELLISIIPFIDINKYGLNVKTAAHIDWSLLAVVVKVLPVAIASRCFHSLSCGIFRDFVYDLFGCGVRD